MKIRQFEPGDQPRVVELWIRAGLTVPWNDPAADIATYLASGQALFLVADLQGAIVGTAMGGFDGHRGWIYYLAIDAPHRRSGLGRKLVRTIEDELAAKGCPKVNLMVREDNHAAASFYRSLGYDQSDVTTFGRRLD